MRIGGSFAPARTGSVKAARKSKRRGHFRGFLAVAAFPSALSTRAYARSPSSPRSVTSAAFNSSPNMDLTGYRHTETSDPSPIAPAFDMRHPPSPRPIAYARRSLHSQIPKAPRTTKAKTLTHRGMGTPPAFTSIPNRTRSNWARAISQNTIAPTSDARIFISPLFLADPLIPITLTLSRGRATRRYQSPQRFGRRNDRVVRRAR